MVKLAVTMRIAEYLLILCLLLVNSHGLKCRSEGGPKEGELKKIYNICIKQEIKSNNSNDEVDSDQYWRETRRHNQWSQDNVSGRRGDGYYGGEIGEKNRGEENRVENRDRNEEQIRLRQGERGNENRKNRMQHRERDGDERMYARGGRDGAENNNGDNRPQRNNGVNDRNDFFEKDNYSGYNNYQYSTQPSRRYKRERPEINSGKRSQYNPNLYGISASGDRYKDEEKNSSNNDSKKNEQSRACAIHCLLENMQMTGESGMPDRYLLTNTITRNVKDDDLKDFLQESIEECFQLLNNENTDDKCEFSRNLMICMSEKGRANCDDWHDDFQF